MDSDHDVRLEAVLDGLANGRLGLPAAAAQVRALRFPQAPLKPPGQLMREAAEGDLHERPPAGTARELARAYHQGRITYRQYEALADAAEQAGQGRSPGA